MRTNIFLGCNFVREQYESTVRNVHKLRKGTRVPAVPIFEYIVQYVDCSLSERVFIYNMSSWGNRHLREYYLLYCTV